MIERLDLGVLVESLFAQYFNKSFIVNRQLAKRLLLPVVGLRVSTFRESSNVSYR